MARTLTACRDCGKLFYGGTDKQYCEKCTEARKKSVMREKACQDCGRSFMGGPRAKRCPECRVVAQREASRRHSRTGTKRPLGSIDVCIKCGKKYVVNSARQKYCKDCANEAVLEAQRAYKTQYNRESGFYEDRGKKRKDFTKICVCCGKPFKSSVSTNLCSEACREKRKKEWWQRKSRL